MQDHQFDCTLVKTLKHFNHVSTFHFCVSQKKQSEVWNK